MTFFIIFRNQFLKEIWMSLVLVQVYFYGNSQMVSFLINVASTIYSVLIKIIREVLWRSLNFYQHHEVISVRPPLKTWRHYTAASSKIPHERHKFMISIKTKQSPQPYTYHYHVLTSNYFRQVILVVLVGSCD